MKIIKLVITAAVAAALVLAGTAFSLAARTTPPAASKPTSQVVDGLYKTVTFYVGKRAYLCELTRLPASYSTFTVSPAYTCTRQR